jgi:hypothetical protein
MAGVDHLVAKPFVERGEATIGQGALRWLADVRWPERPIGDLVDGQGPGSAEPPDGYPSPGGGPLSRSTSAR